MISQADIQRPLEDEPTPGTAGGVVHLRPAVPVDSTDAQVYRCRLAAPGLVLRAATAVRATPHRTVTAVMRWARRPAGRLVLPGALITGLVGSAVASGVFVVPAAGSTRPAAGAAAPAAAPVVPAQQVEISGGEESAAPPTGEPDPTATPAGDELPADTVLSWAQQMSIRTGIPLVALQAYGYAELVVAQTRPDCNLTWTTLAAIGKVESDHGRANGAALLADGRAWPPIIGDPLDGQGGRMHIPDTDAGELDGDPVYDRAVGPMQFIPQTWGYEAVDATGNGTADINNIHDAALAAANYLCNNGRDLSTTADWWAAILSYNNVRVYAEQVFSAANEYGRQSRT